MITFRITPAISLPCLIYAAQSVRWKQPRDSRKAPRGLSAHEPSQISNHQAVLKLSSLCKHRSTHRLEVASGNARYQGLLADLDVRYPFACSAFLQKPNQDGRENRGIEKAGDRAGALRGMNMNRLDPAFATAVESADAIFGRRISATELLNFTLRRVDLHNPRINAIIWQFREQAMARARQADEMLANGKTWGPLHGVPVTIKGSIRLSGLA